MPFTVISAAISNGKTHVTFESNTLTVLNSYFNVECEQLKKSYPFKVTELRVAKSFEIVELKDTVMVTAVQVGYYASDLSKQTDFDIRSIIDAKVEIISNIDIINKIKEESTWC